MVKHLDDVGAALREPMGAAKSEMTTPARRPSGRSIRSKQDRSDGI